MRKNDGTYVLKGNVQKVENNKELALRKNTLITKENQNNRKEGKMTKTIVFIILVGLVIVFVMQNTQVVEFQFLTWKVSMSKALLLLGTFVLGLIIGRLSRKSKPKVPKTV